MKHSLTLAPFAVTRRQFLKTGGALVVGFSFAGSIAEALGQATLPAPKDFNSVDAWLAIDGNRRVTVFSGHVELGTGVETALTQMVADELDVAFASVVVVQGDTLLTPDQGPTFGSLTIQVAGLQLRKAAACAKRAMLALATKELGAASDDLEIENSVISGAGKRITYATLTKRRALVTSGTDAACPPRSRAPDDSAICQMSPVDRCRWASAKIPPAHPTCGPHTRPPKPRRTATAPRPRPESANGLRHDAGRMDRRR